MREGESSARVPEPPASDDDPRAGAMEALLNTLDRLQDAHDATAKKTTAAHEDAVAQFQSQAATVLAEIKQLAAADRQDVLLEVREAVRTGTISDFSKMGVVGLLWPIALICAVALGVWFHGSITLGAPPWPAAMGSSTTFLGGRGGLYVRVVERPGEAKYGIYVTDEGHAVFGSFHAGDGAGLLEGTFVPDRPALPGRDGRASKNASPPHAATPPRLAAPRAASAPALPADPVDRDIDIEEAAP